MRFRTLAIAAALACVAACAGGQPAQPPSSVRSDAGNAAEGLAYAEQVCARCHAVAPGATASPVAEAPAFQTVANTPGMTGVALNVWLHTPHRNMPDIIVDPQRVDDLAAYLASLRARA